MRVLLIEDDEMIASSIEGFLGGAEMRCDHVASLDDAAHALENEEFGAVVLDLNLPDGCGLTLLRRLRRRRSKAPVIVLTARNTLTDRLTGLDLGADDYLAKPFDLEELAARLRAVHRRAHGRADQTLRYEALEISLNDMSVQYNGARVEVPVSQFRLLQYLVENCGRLRTKKQIIEALYSWDESVAENTVEVYVSQLRKILWPDIIKTVRGVGYLVPKSTETQSKAASHSLRG